MPAVSFRIPVLLSLVLLPGLVSAAAPEKGSSYVAFNSTALQINGHGDAVDESFMPGAIVVRAGHSPSQNLSVEARLGVGAVDGTKDIGGTEYTLALDSLYGLYGVGHLPLGSWFSFYGVFGYTSLGGYVAVDNGNADPGSFRSHDFSYGSGFEIHFSEQISLGMEGMRYINKLEDDFDATAVSIGLSVTY